MTDTDQAPAADGAGCPRCQATEAAARAELGLVAKACIGHLGRVTDDVIGLIREARASEQAALYAWKAATDLSAEARAADPTTRAEWHLAFVTDSRDTLVTGNERPSRTEGGRWLHTVTLPFDEALYRELAAKAEAKGADDVRLSKRTVATTPGEWEPV